MVFLILLLSSPLFAQDNWPEFLGPTQDNHSPTAAIPAQWSETQNVTWKTAIPGQGWSSPVIFDNQIWLTTATEDGLSRRALCIDKTTGKILHDIEVFRIPEPAHKNSFNSYASPTSVIEKGRVYVCFGADGSACLDTATGRILWKNTDLKVNHMEGAGSSPILYKDLYILNCDGTDVQYMAALDKNTGQIAWKSPRNTVFGFRFAPMRKAYSTPLMIQVDGKDQLIAVSAYRLAGYDPDTGKEIWFCHLPGFSNTSRPVFGQGLLFVPTGYERSDLWAIRPGGQGDITPTNIAWKFTEASALMPTPILVGDELYMPCDSGVVRCLDAKTGKELWKQRLAPAFVASPLYANNLVYVFTNKGLAIPLKPGKEFQPLPESQLEGRFMASPAVSGNALFLRTDTHLYRIEKP
jgi:outer membrane protein assembly factor BamB